MFNRRKSLEQQGGAQSTNLQAARDVVVNNGNSLSEVVDFVRETISANALEMRKVAKEVFEERIDAFSEMLLEKAKDEPELVNATSDPDVQHVLIEAGLGFARTGDEDMAAILIDLLADRSKEETRSLLSVVINDAVSTASRLTDGEIAILTIYWRLIHTINNSLLSPVALAQFIQSDIAPLVEYLPRGEASYLHLQSLGCAVVQITSVSFEAPWTGTYNALFTKGFTFEEIPESLRAPLQATPGMLIRNMRNPSLLQLGALNEQVLRDMAKDAASEPFADEIVAFMQQRTMSPDEVLDIMTRIDPVMVNLREVWDATPLNSLRLSAVGIAIAHANWRHLTGDTTPLSVWINEHPPLT